MTNTNEFIARVESDLRTNRKLDDLSRSAFQSLPAESRAAFQQMMVFVGADMGLLDKSYRTNPGDRANAAALMFLQLAIDTHNPAWSSWRLDRMLDAVMNTPQGEIGDLLRGLDLAFAKYEVKLTETVANLVKEIVVLSFTRARHSYDKIDWTWANEELVKPEISPARCCFFMQALPPNKGVPAAIVTMIRVLADTPYSAKAVDYLSDEFERADVKPLLDDLNLPQLVMKK